MKLFYGLKSQTSPIALIALSLSMLAYGEYSQVPGSLANRAVYYPVVHQLNAFSCGYNALFNAANFETWCGFSNPVHRYDTFKELTLSYLAKAGCRSDASSNNRVLAELGSRLKLKPLYQLMFYRENRSIIVPPGEVEVWYKEGTSRDEIKRLFDQAHIAQGKELITQGKNYLEKCKGTPAVLHFICSVSSYLGGHYVLISLYQNSSGRALYLFDNLNEPLTMNHDTVRYLSYLCTEFSVSDKGVFSAPQLPRRWPYLDRTY